MKLYYLFYLFSSIAWRYQAILLNNKVKALPFKYYRVILISIAVKELTLNITFK